MVTISESRSAGERSAAHGKAKYALELRSKKLRRTPPVIVARGMFIM